MQEVRVTKVFGAGIAVFVAAFALVAAMFAVQPAYAAQGADLAAGTTAISTASKTPALSVKGEAVVIDGTITLNAENAVASQTGKWEWKVVKGAEFVTLGSTNAQSTTVTGVADGEATIQVTFTTDSNVSGSATVVIPVKGIKSSSTVVVNGLEYQRNGIDTVALVKTKGNKDLKKKTIKVPNTISVADDGQHVATYKVTELKKYALNAQRKTTSIIVGDNVETIGNHAFCSCPKLSKLVIGKNVASLGKYIIHKQNNKLKTITIKSGKLTKSGVSKCFKKNKFLKTVKLTGAAKAKFKAYKKYFKKANCGKKVTVKK